MEIMYILESLDRGDISVDKAIFLLKNRNKRNRRNIFTRKSGWFRIHIKDEEHNFKFFVPISLLSFGLSISKKVIASKYLKDNDGIQIAQNILSNIEYRDLRSLVNTIKSSGRINLVEVQDGATIVSVRIV